MSTRPWDRLRALFRRERDDVADALSDATARANEALDRRERELAATPEERLALEQDRAAAQDEDFEELRRKIEGGHA